MLRSSSLRIAIFYTLAFAIAVIALGIVTLFSTHAALNTLFDERILSDSGALQEEYRTEGIDAVTSSVRERDSAPGALDFGLQSPTMSPVVGNLSRIHTQLGWSTVITPSPREYELGPSKIYTVRLPDGYRLLVGDDTKRIKAVDCVILRSFGFALFGILVVGGVGGYALSHSMHRRILSIAATAQAIIDGDIGRRMPVRGRRDELDRLAVTLNRMLDRIGGLMETLRQVSTDVAHDLRTPLTRLRHRLESLVQEPGGRASRESIELAIGELDATLGIFAAILRISQIESGARRAAFHPTDLSVIATNVVEAFRPSAEEIQQSLVFVDDGPSVVDGDAEMLTQMLANLVENAIRYAGAKAHICVRAGTIDGQVQLAVIDDGPGVPESERERLFDRFYRLETSRSTPGSGLGLALVAAVTRLHNAEASLHDAEPGLEARIVFNPRS